MPQISQFPRNRPNTSANAKCQSRNLGSNAVLPSANRILHLAKSKGPSTWPFIHQQPPPSRPSIALQSCLSLVRTPANSSPTNFIQFAKTQNRNWSQKGLLSVRRMGRGQFDEHDRSWPAALCSFLLRTKEENQTFSCFPESSIKMRRQSFNASATSLFSLETQRKNYAGGSF